MLELRSRAVAGAVGAIRIARAIKGADRGGAADVAGNPALADDDLGLDAPNPAAPDHKDRFADALPAGLG